MFDDVITINRRGRGVALETDIFEIPDLELVYKLNFKLWQLKIENFENQGFETFATFRPYA